MPSRFRQPARRAFLAGLGGSILPAQPAPPDLDLFFGAFSTDAREGRAALRELARSWRNSYAIMLLELLRSHIAFAGPETRPEPEFDPSDARHRLPQPLSSAAALRARIRDFLVERTGKNFGFHLADWGKWCWSLPYEPHPRYAEFKALLYAGIDSRMKAFFPKRVASKIRLDQIEWGGVRVNGIPPLVSPATIPAAEARYLKDSNIVFGLDIGGQARAYPRRILAWHEMARDTVGGVDWAIVYCTLCGTVIPWRAEVKGRKFAFGTSGLLYEASKLMFDEETKSLWSTLQGKPVVGALAESDLELAFAPVVTTTWGEWRAEHPETLVLSLETGHMRDYSEGAAYRDYFSTDELMFEVSRRDPRLRNKDEVLVIRLKGRKPLAIAVRLLDRRPHFEMDHEGVKLTVRTGKGGSNRVYAGGERVPAHRAFWFGWYAQFPETVLVK